MNYNEKMCSKATLQEEKDSLVISYPDSLVNMWRYVRAAPDELDDRCWGAVWKELTNIIAGCLKKEGIKSCHDAAQDFLCEMLRKACPVHIRSVSILVSEAKKYLARKNNPVQNELNKILHKALRNLEKSGVVERDAASKKHRISNQTLFAVTGTPVSQKASLDDYKNNRYSVDIFQTKLRKGSAEHSQILTSANAKVLVLQLLNAFGGWTKKTDLFTAMQNHIPEQMKIVDIQAENKDDEVSLENIVAVEDDYMDKFDAMQINRIAGITAERIWEKICKVSNKVFCLFYLPKTFYEHDVKAEDIGVIPTVYNHNKKISEIVQDEIKSYLDDNDGDKSKAVRRAVRKILGSLQGRCTKSGYNPGSYSRKI